MPQTSVADGSSALLSGDSGSILLPAGGLTIAVDHGLGGVARGLEEGPERILAILDCDPDGLLVTLGMLRSLGPRIRERGVRTICAVDAVLAISGMVIGQASVATAEQCLEAGGDGIKVIFQIGLSDSAFAAELSRVAAVIAEAQRVQLPVMVEPVLIGRDPLTWKGKEAARIADGCRVASELGADVLKIPMLPEPETRAIVEMSYCPVTVMGGDPQGRADLLAQARGCLDAGVRGFVFGRNVWGDRDEVAVTTSLRELLSAA